MKNIHILPTNKTSSLYFEDNNSELIFLKGYFVHKNFDIKPQNIYITSDEEIKFNDYITDSYKVWQWKDNSSLLGRKKIILTTDQDLIKDGVQAIDDKFLEWFVKNPSCEYVKVNDLYRYTNENTEHIGYKIIIPKEEPKFENSIENSINVMSIANSMFGKKEEPKQETLEEELLQQIKFCLICKNDSQAIRLIEKYGFQKQEQMYSEEEVLDILFSMSVDNPNNITKWFKQFKNK